MLQRGIRSGLDNVLRDIVEVWNVEQIPICVEKYFGRRESGSLVSLLNG
jgi:hypothetical protein